MTPSQKFSYDRKIEKLEARVEAYPRGYERYVDVDLDDDDW